MKRFCYSRVAIAAVVLAALTATSAFAATTKDPVHRHVRRPGLDQGRRQHRAIAANGTGKGTLIGAGTITGAGTGDTSQQPCIPFGGTGTMTGARRHDHLQAHLRRERLRRRGRSHLQRSRPTSPSLKATGKLAKAKGTLKFTGVYSHDDGSFSVKVTRHPHEVTDREGGMMKRILILGAALAVGRDGDGVGDGRQPASRSRRPRCVQVFVAAQTVTTDGAMSSWFAPGEHRRLPRVRRRPEDEEGRRPEGRASTSTSRSRTSRTSS